MSTLSPQQIAGLVLRHTSNRSQAALAVATALAESGGRSDARNVNTDSSIDRGLWQINSRWHPSVTASMADDPATATAYAARISRNFADLGAWYGYKNGGYRQYMTVATAAVSSPVGPESGGGGLRGALLGGAVLGVPGAVLGAATSVPEKLGGGVIDAGKGAIGAVESVGTFLARLSSRGTWVRVLQVIGGMGLIVAGGMMINRDLVVSALSVGTDYVPGGKAAKAAAAVVPGGKAASAAGAAH